MGVGHSNSSSGSSNPRDPRSPTPDISRTPLRENEDKSSPITKNVDLTKECFEKYGDPLPATLNPAVKILTSQLDPRSPTVDFQRTPLAVLIKNPELMAMYNRINASDFLNVSTISCGEVEQCPTVPEPKSLEKELENLSVVENEQCPTLPEPKSLERELENLSVAETEQCPTVPELESLEKEPDNISVDEVTTEEIAPSRVPIMGLLETNLDYVETDLDTIRRKPRRFKNLIKCDEKENPKVVEAAKDEFSSQVIANRSEPPKDKSPDVVTNQSNTENDIHDSIGSKVEIMEIFNYNNSLQKKTHRHRGGNDTDFDSLLIYEDDIATVAKTTTAVRKVDSPRTPLAQINVPQQQQPTSKTESESKQAARSKIPVKVKYQSSPRYLAVRNSHATPKKVQQSKKTGQRKVAMEAVENTPPKVTQARWDQDNSVIL